MPATRPASRDAALTELQRLHAAILASRAKRGVVPEAAAPVVTARVAPSITPSVTLSPEAIAARELTSRLQASADTHVDVAPEPARSRRGWWLALGAAVLLAGVWAAMTLSQRSETITEAAPPKSTPAPEAAAAEPAPTPPPVAPAASAAAPEAAAPAAAPAHPVQVTLTAIRPVWLRVTVDGSRAHQGELPAGGTLSFEGDRAVVVRSGDAGGVQATVNGTDRGALGLRGWPLTVSITPAGIEPLTPTRPEP